MITPSNPFYKEKDMMHYVLYVDYIYIYIYIFEALHTLYKITDMMHEHVVYHMGVN